MPSGSVDLAGKICNQSGSPKVGLTISLWEAADFELAKDGGVQTALTTTPTDADGRWSFAAQDITKVFMVSAADGTKELLLDSRNKIQLTNIDIIDDISVDTIYEHTAAAGVTIDGVVLKDGGGTFGATVITDGVLTDAGGFQMAAVLDMANNAINNIGNAGNDFGAAFLDLAAGYTIRGAGALSLTTTASNIYLNPTSTIYLDKGVFAASVFAFYSATATAAAAADQVKLGGHDYAAGDRRLWIQSEAGGLIYLGNDALTFAAAGSITTAAGGILTLTSAAALVLQGTGGAITVGIAGSNTTITAINSMALRSATNQNLTLGHGTTERWRVNAVGVLTSTGGSPEFVTGDGVIVAEGGIAFTDIANAWIDDATHGTGTVTHYIGNQTITTASDIRLKKDIVAVADAGAILGLLRPVEHSWSDRFGGHVAYNQRGRFVSLVAQEAISVVPFAVNANGGANCSRCLSGQPCSGHGDWHMQYDYLVPLVIKGWQEHDSRLSLVEQQVKGIAERTWPTAMSNEDLFRRMESMIAASPEHRARLKQLLEV